jgi:hypothetical protein
MNVLPGAHCVITLVDGRDAACTVHTHYAPCPHDGKPASTSVMHSTAVPSRESVLAYWREVTDEQRTLVIHCGSWDGDREHAIDVCDVDCWCGPEVVFARRYRPEVGR